MYQLSQATEDTIKCWKILNKYALICCTLRAKSIRIDTLTQTGHISPLAAVPRPVKSNRDTVEMDARTRICAPQCQLGLDWPAYMICISDILPNAVLNAFL